MTAPSKNWSNIEDTQIDADSPLDTTLLTAIRDDLVHIKEWLGKDYAAAVNHCHDGADSAQLSSADIIQTGGISFFEDFLGVAVDPRLYTDSYCALSTTAPSCGVLEVVLPGNTMGGLDTIANPNFSLASSNVLTYETRWKCLAGYGSIAPDIGFADNRSNGPWNGNQIVFTSDTGTNWLTKTVSAGVVTTTDTGVAVSATSWQKLKITASATSVKFYVDDVLKATHTTNIPTTAAMGLVSIFYRVTSGATFLVDYVTVTGSVRNN